MWNHSIFHPESKNGQRRRAIFTDYDLPRAATMAGEGFIMPETALGPSKLTPHLIDTFAQVIALGNYPTVACQVVRIHISTYRLWMRRGEDAVREDDPYRQFYLRVKEAEAASEAYALSKWRGHFGTNYKAARDYLARRFSQRWGPTYKVTIEVEKELTRLMEKLAEKLPPEIYQQVILALADAQEELGDDPEDDESFVDLTSFVEVAP